RAFQKVVIQLLGAVLLDASVRLVPGRGPHHLLSLLDDLLDVLSGESVQGVKRRQLHRYDRGAPLLKLEGKEARCGTHVQDAHAPHVLGELKAGPTLTEIVHAGRDQTMR